MKRLLIFLPAYLCLVASTSVADQNLADESRMDSFKKNNPNARFQGAQYFESEGFFQHDQPSNLIYGANLALGATPLESAQNFCEKIKGIYATEIGQLVPRQLPSGEVLQGVMWNKETQSHRFHTFRFKQMVEGIPVFRSGIGFLVRNEDGFPVVMSGNNFKEMQGFQVAQARNEPTEVTNVMKLNAALAMAGPNLRIHGTESTIDNLRQQREGIQVDEEQLVIWAGNTNVVVEPELAIQFLATQGSPSNFETYRSYLIVAAVDDGEVLLAETQIHADVSGTVSGQGTDGIAAAECEPSAAFALPYAEVSITGGVTVFADGDGNFTIPNTAGGTVTVNSRLEGMYFNLVDESAGATTPVISMNVSNSGSVDFLHNPNDTEFGTANVNAYLHANIVRDFVLEVEPTFPTIGNQLGFNIRTNRNQSCNAFYCPATQSINFFTSGSGCNNTSYADVIYHEYGHHLVRVTGNGQGQFGEGCSDVMAILIEDNPDLALGFGIVTPEPDCNVPLRTAENFRTYPCVGPIHDCGQLISGCVWDTINEIREFDPDNAVGIVSQLFLNMLPVRGAMGGSSIIGPEITLIILELDDDDGDLSNGSPHYFPIANAFNAHNMMAPELDVLCGDVNRDGTVNFLDIAPFIDVLSNGGYQVEADADKNGQVNFLDIAPFIDILSS